MKVITIVLCKAFLLLIVGVFLLTSYVEANSVSNNISVSASSNSSEGHASVSIQTIVNGRVVEDRTESGSGSISISSVITDNNATSRVIKSDDSTTFNEVSVPAYSANDVDQMRMLIKILERLVSLLQLQVTMVQ